MAVTIRANDVKASNLIFVGLAVSLTSILLYPPKNPTRLGHFSMNTILGLTFLLLVAWAWGIQKGIRWVKVLFCIMTALGILLYLKKLPQHEPIGYTILTVIGYTINVWALLIFKDLLQKPSTNAPVGG
jgi:hypothetical protein